MLEMTTVMLWLAEADPATPDRLAGRAFADTGELPKCEMGAPMLTEAVEPVPREPIPNPPALAVASVELVDIVIVGV